MDPCVLWARAGIVGSLAFLLGVVGHVTADGLLPGPALLATLALGSVVLSGPVLARPASRARLVVLLVGGQAAIHSLLTVTAGHAGDRPPVRGALPARDPFGALPVVGGHRVGSMQDAFLLGTVPGADGGRGSAVAPALPIGHLLDHVTTHAPMMAAHLAAAVLVALWLAHGERLLWSLISLTGRRVVLVVLMTVPVGPPRGSLRRFVRAHAPAGPRSRWLVRPGTLRGPPLLAA